MLRLTFSLVLASLLVPLAAHADEPAFACNVSDPGPLSELEARTAADLTCSELQKAHAPPARYTMTVGQLGSKLRIALSNGTDQRDAWVGSADEIPTALPRLAQALTGAQTVASTERVDNVLSSEATAPRTKSGQLHASLGMFGGATVGTGSAIGGGFSGALLYRADRYGLFLEGRIGGIGSESTKLTGGGVGIGSHLYLSQTDFSPLVGGGLEISSYAVKGSGDGSGAGAFAEIGLAGFRTNKVGFVTTARIAAPFYTLDRHKDYAMPVTLNLALTFL